jgi:hypothetical protein
VYKVEYISAICVSIYNLRIARPISATVSVYSVFLPNQGNERENSDNVSMILRLDGIYVLHCEYEYNTSCEIGL